MPDIRQWLPKGQVVPVEAHTDVPALAIVDRQAGIDAWLVTDGVQGIASRVQYGVPRDSFTIRVSRPMGARTELEKRLAALQDPLSHYVLPHYTVQAYVIRPRTGRLLLALVVETEQLLRFIVENPNLLERRRNPEDGTEFVVVWATDLVDAGVEVRRTVQPGVMVQRRDGWWLAVVSLDTKELIWVPEQSYFEQYAKDRECALACAVKMLKPSMDSPEDVLRLADQVYEWLRGRAPA